MVRDTGRSEAGEEPRDGGLRSRAPPQETPLSLLQSDPCGPMVPYCSSAPLRTFMELFSASASASAYS